MGSGRSPWGAFLNHSSWVRHWLNAFHQNQWFFRLWKSIDDRKILLLFDPLAFLFVSLACLLDVTRDLWQCIKIREWMKKWGDEMKRWSSGCEGCAERVPWRHHWKWLKFKGSDVGDGVCKGAMRKIKRFSGCGTIAMGYKILWRVKNISAWF